MWQVLLLILLAVVVIKFLKVSFFWSSRGVPYESYVRYLYRVFYEIHAYPTFDVLRQGVKDNGRIYGSYRGMSPSLVVADVEIAKEVLVKQFGNFFNRSFEVSTGDSLWDNTLLQLPYDKWKPVRTVMGYTFTSAKMRSMIPKLDKVAKRLMSKLNVVAKSNDNGIVLQSYLQCYGIDSIAAISFGIELNCIDDPDNQFVRQATKIFQPGLASLLLMVFPSAIRYIPFIHFPTKSVTRFFGELANHMIEEKRKHLDEVMKNKTADIIDYHLVAQRDDPKSGLTDEIIASQAFLFLIGGLDTTVSTLEFVTYYLAINPETQEELYQDIKKVLGDRQDVEYDDLQKIELLEPCTLEALRLLPNGFIVDRVCSKDTVVAGITIEKGMTVEFPIPPIHRDPQYFSDPDSFKPHRFLKSGEVSSEAGSYLSFGDGPKNCAGRRLALLNISVLLVNILLKMKLERTGKTPVPLRIKNGLHFKDISQDPMYIKLIPR